MRFNFFTFWAIFRSNTGVQRPFLQCEDVDPLDRRSAATEILFWIPKFLISKCENFQFFRFQLIHWKICRHSLRVISFFIRPHNSTYLLAHSKKLFWREQVKFQVQLDARFYYKIPHYFHHGAVVTKETYSRLYLFWMKFS